MSQNDIEELNYNNSESEDEEEADDELDPISAERKRRAKRQDHLRRTAGEPVKPAISEVLKLMPGFGSMLRNVLAG